MVVRALVLGSKIDAGWIANEVSQFQSIEIVGLLSRREWAHGRARFTTADVVLFCAFHTDDQLAFSYIVQRAGTCPVLAVVDSFDPGLGIRLWSAGVAGICKASDSAVLANIIGLMSQGFLVFPLEIIQEGSRSIGCDRVRTVPVECSTREAEVLYLLASGMSNVQIAKRLVISTTTRPYSRRTFEGEVRRAQSITARQLCV